MKYTLILVKIRTIEKLDNFVKHAVAMLCLALNTMKPVYTFMEL